MVGPSPHRNTHDRPIQLDSEDDLAHHDTRDRVRNYVIDPLGN